MKFGLNRNVHFCDKAENLCKQKNFEYKKYMLDVDFSREELVEKFPSARTFPQITIDGELIGGYTEFEAKSKIRRIIG